MKNSEKYKDKLFGKYAFDDIYCNEVRSIMLKEYGRSCDDTHCSQCSDLFTIWLQKERKELKTDWNKIEIDTPILVSNDKKSWQKCYFAFCKDDDVVYAWEDGKTSKETIVMIRWNYVELL